MVEEAPNVQDAMSEAFARIMADFAVGMTPLSRHEAHEWLDRLYDRRERFERDYGGTALPDDPDADPARQEEAAAIYADSLRLTGRILARIKEEVCPIFQPGDPVSMREALADTIALVGPVIPHRTNVVSVAESSLGFRTGNPNNSLSVLDIGRWLGMLDKGATPEIFKPNTLPVAGNRKYDWYRMRWRAYMAFWAIRLQVRGVSKASRQVAAAFGCGGNYHAAISRVVLEIKKAFRSDKGAFGLSPHTLSAAMVVAYPHGVADEFKYDNAVICILYMIVFDHHTPPPNSLKEAGQRYQAFLRNPDALT